VFARIRTELRLHAPFTAFGALTGIAIMLLLNRVAATRSVSGALFWSLHPLHVLLSAWATTAMVRLQGNSRWKRAILIGYVGSVGVATLSDSLIPYLGEWLLDLPDRGLHLGFIERWWLINPLAAAGIILGYTWPRTRLPHAGHVLLSTWASLFHMTLAMDGPPSLGLAFLVGAFLFVAVWVPCCTSDIVFPLLFVQQQPTDARGSSGMRRTTSRDNSRPVDGSTAARAGARHWRTS
jgi:hypothetical protein